jgi:hypothetical protein
MAEKKSSTPLKDTRSFPIFEKENYLPVKNFTASDFSDHIDTRSFIKLSCQLSFLKWNDAPDLLSESFIRITNWFG